MSLKIKGVFFPTIVLVNLGLLFFAYGIAGFGLYLLHQDNQEAWLYVLSSVLFGSGWAVCQNLGGILGAIALIIASFWHLPWQLALTAGGIGLFAIWIGLQDTDRVWDSDRPLLWYEWLGGVLMLGNGIVLAVIVHLIRGYQAWSPWALVVLFAAIAYTLATTGAQLKSAEIPPKVSLYTVLSLMLIGVVSGWIYGQITAPRFAPI
jgi:hypothetical protein